MADKDVVRQVIAAAHGNEGYEVRHFEVYRDHSLIKVRLLDAGAEETHNRFQVELIHESLPEGSHLGNPGSTVEEALRNAHWEFLKLEQ